MQIVFLFSQNWFATFCPIFFSLKLISWNTNIFAGNTQSRKIWQITKNVTKTKFNENNFFGSKKKLSNYYSECFLLDFVNEGKRNWLWPKNQLWGYLKVRRFELRLSCYLVLNLQVKSSTLVWSSPALTPY
jgi:hypothetical protein